MNIAEKKRAEQMVLDALKAKPAKAKADPKPSKELVAKVRALYKEVSDAGFSISRNYNGSLTEEAVYVNSNHPEVVAANKAYEEAQRAHTAHQRDLIAAVWNGDYDFESLRKELAK